MINLPFNLPFQKPFGSGPITAVNIGTKYIKIITVSKGNNGFRLENFVIEQIASEPAKNKSRKEILSRALKNALDKTGLTSSEVITGISGPAIMVRYINLPPMSKSDLESAVKFEAKTQIPFDLKDVILDFQVLDQDKGAEGRKIKVLLIAAQRNFIQEHIELLEKQGLVPFIIDMDSFALINAFLYANEKEIAEYQALALVNLGAASTNVSILHKGVPLFTRDIPLGGDSLTEILSKRLNVDFSQAEKLKMEIEEGASPQFGIISPVLENIANEIRRCFDYYETQTTLAGKMSFKVFLSGGTAGLKGIDNFLNKILDLPVSLWNPFKKFEIKKGRYSLEELEKKQPHLCVGAGLILRAKELV